MKQEDKDLIIKDLCGRLPYNVKCAILSEKQPFTLTTIEVDYINGHLFNFLELRRGFVVQVYTSELKPYLYPLSSMTEEQSIELFNLFGISLANSIGTDYIKINECTGITFFLDKGFDIETHLDKLLDWLNKNHFDYRGLIEKGLAIDVTGLNIY